MLSDLDFADLIFEGYPSNNGVALGRRYWQFFYLPDAMSNHYLTKRGAFWIPVAEHAPLDQASTLLNALGIMHPMMWCDTALGGDSNLFTSEPKNRGTAVHETAHKIFKLSDEYPGANILAQPTNWPHPNVYPYEKQNDCNAYNALNGLGPCSSFDARSPDGELGTWFSSEMQPAPGQSVPCGQSFMRPDSFCIMLKDCDDKVPPFGPTCLRRIAWYYQTQLHQPAPVNPECDTLPPTPENIPKRIVLFGIRPVLLLRFTASGSGYSLASSENVSGVPVPTGDMGGDLLITARDGQGSTVSQFSTGNPRVPRDKLIRGKGGALESAEFAVALPDPDKIRSVEVEVRRGPDRSIKCVFSIPRKEGEKCGSP